MIGKGVPRYVEKLIAKRDKAANMRAVRVEVKRRDKGKCRCCGKPGTDLHHILYRARGGRDEASNLITLCRSCHTAEHSHVLKVYGADAASVTFEWHESMRGLR